jgi:hypothetical protein
VEEAKAASGGLIVGALLLLSFCAVSPFVALLLLVDLWRTWQP